MNTVTLTALQALQLAALGPCLFLIAYLLISAQNKKLVAVPVIYFLSLACSFLSPLLTAMPAIDNKALRTVLLFNEHLAPELGFLFILQLILKAPPPLIYWLILALPLVGGGPLLYLSANGQDVCFHTDACVPAAQLMTLYRVIGSSFIFMLLVVLMRRMPTIRRNDTIRSQKYWMIAMLILYSLMVMAADLARTAQWLTARDYIAIKTVIGISFLYLMTTSLFRVFNRHLGLSPITGGVSETDKKLAEDIRALLEKEKPYRQLGYSRAAMADHFRITEQHLSRVINQHFRQSFSELMNGLRTREAEAMLTGTDKPITVIAFDCGFSSITSFNRVFKEATGKSPSAYRKG